MRKLLSLFALWTMLLSQSPAQVQMDRINATGVNGVINPLRFPGSDFGAQVNAASAFGGTNAVIVPPPGNYTYTTPIVLVGNQTLGDCRVGPNQINLTYNGSGAGIATSGSNKICGVFLAIGTSATEGYLLKGTDIWLQDSGYSGGGASTKDVHITAYDTVNHIQSGTVYVKQFRCLNTNGTQFYIDHVVEAHLDHVYCSATGSSSTGVVIDTGSAGVYLDHTGFTSNTLGGLIVKDSTSGVGGVQYGHWPWQLFFDTAVFDCAFTCPSVDALLFDSSLGTNPLFAAFTNSWGAGYGLNGLHISGGQGIKFGGGGKLKQNGLNGVLIDNPNVDVVEIGNNFIVANNRSNTNDATGGHGVYVSAASNHINIHDNIIANILDSGGHQKLGIKVAAVLADRLRISNNNLNPNETAYLSNSTSGAYNSCLNDSDPGDNASQCWLSGQLHVHGSIFSDLGISASTSIIAPIVALNSNISWTSGAGVPSAGTCTAANGGSLYSRTDGTTTTTLYVCDNSTHVWTAK